MTKAFIFDMDGVLIDTESEWEKEPEFFEELYGKEINQKLENLVGYSIQSLYKKAQEYGYSMGWEDHYDRYNTKAKEIYNRADITEGTHELIQKLRKADYKIGLVSASPREWINQALKRIPISFDLIISLDGRRDLNHKPAPDGYLEMMKKFDVRPEDTVILEDSNIGIQAAQKAGAFVIGFKQHLTSGYSQKGADVYAKNMNEVVEIIKNR